MAAHHGHLDKSKILCSWILIPIVLHVSTVNGQQFRSVPTTVKTYENETVLLPCYHNSPYRYVRWSRDDLLLADSRYPDLTPPPRVQLWKNGSLEVSQVQTEDTGDYTCEIITEGGRALQQHAIEVQYPPIISMYPSGEIEVRVGQILEVICDATGVPTPFISWDFKDTNVTYENKRHLTILVENKDFTSSVECTANNGVGDEARATLNVIVHYEPEVNAKASTVHTKNGQLAQIECTVQSVPPATMHWFHNSLPLSSDRRYTKQDNAVTETVHRHVLFIRNVKDGDLGQYECKAENKVGIRGAHIELTGRPMTVSFKPSTELTSPNKHNLIWQVESFSPVIEYKLKFRKIPSGDITPNKRYPNVAWSELIIPSDGSAGQLHSTGYTLQGLQSASVYEVVVLARNRYGWSESSNILRFATGGEIQLENSSFQTTEIVDYTDENVEPYITDNVITKDFYDYTGFQIEDAESSGANTNKNWLMLLVVISSILFIRSVKS